MGRPALKVILDLATYRGKYLAPAQLARYVPCSTSHVYNQIKKGALPVRKIGNLVRIRTVDARAWVGEEQPPRP